MARQRRAEKLLKTFGEKKKERFNNIYIHGVGRCPHTGTDMHTAVTSWYATETVHIKAKKHTLTPSYIHSSVHACTQTHTEGQIYVKCTLFWDEHQTEIRTDRSQYH